MVLFLFLVTAYYTAGAWIYYQRHKAQGGYAGDAFIQEDPEVGYSVRPDIAYRHTVAPVYQVYTNNIGARVQRKGLHSPSEVDLLAIGDSYTWGHGVNDEETFINILGREKRLTVSNLGVPGFGLTGCLLRFKKFLSLKPKIVIFLLIENDIDRALQPCAPSWSPYCLRVPFVDFHTTGSPFIRPPAPTPPEHYQYTRAILTEHPFGLRDIVWAVRRDFLRISRKDQDSVNVRYRPHQRGTYKEKALDFLLGEMARACRSASAKFVITYIPVVDDIKPASEEFRRTVQKYADERDVFYVDLTGPFMNHVKLYGKETLMAWGVDVHPSETSHRLIAANLSSVLDKIRDLAG